MKVVFASAVLLTAFANVNARPQATSSTVTSQSTSPGTISRSATLNLAGAATITDFTVAIPTGPYLTYSSQIVLATGTGSATTRRSNATDVLSSNTVLAGTNHPTTVSTNGTGTVSNALPSNTQKCNNHVEFCNRQYLNVTEICAHNSAFHIKNNVASNQLYDITAQLDDGVRMIQGETHWYNDTVYACHTSCDLLNAGTLQNELQEVATWVAQHPYDVVTILLVNSDYRNVTDYVNPIRNSGIAQYLYQPPKIPMLRNDWPTYGEMIIAGTRAVIFMDYQADQTTVPYVLDEFSQMWETPFSPTNASFPCNLQRPPRLSDADAANLPYLANHNLNLQITLGNLDILIPVYNNLSQENAISGSGSAGEMMSTCLQQWNRAPSFLLVDYYNYGEWSGSGRSANNSGSVFEVAAKLNGVNYSAACCGTTSSNAGVRLGPARAVVAFVATISGLWLAI